MYVGYFDEVKADREQGRNNYLVAGLIIPMDQIGILKVKSLRSPKSFSSHAS